MCMKRLKQLSPGINAYTVSFDACLLDRLRKVFDTYLRQGLSDIKNAHLLSGNNNVNVEINYQALQFHILSYGNAPLLWISNNNIRTYNIFKSFLRSLDILDDIKQLVDYKKELRMYCGFFVVGNKMDRETWHVDYYNGANAYTLITPLFELDELHGNLIYKNESSTVKKYRYKMNEAVIFGDNFHHATEPYEQTEKLRVMLSLTVGTDKIKYWNILKNTIGDQSNFMILPCGHQKGTCHCLDKC